MEKFMDDQDRRETFWMDVYINVLDNLIPKYGSLSTDDISAIATNIANNAVKDFRSTDAFK